MPMLDDELPRVGQWSNDFQRPVELLLMCAECDQAQKSAPSYLAFVKRDWSSGHCTKNSSATG